MNTKNILNKIVSVTGLALGAFTLSALAGSWTAPTQAPPSGNADAPINVGTSPQHKAGTLALGKSSDALSGLVMDINGAIGAVNLITTGDVTVGGNLGVGTASPSKKLEVVGGPIKATGGLIIETVSADPASPETGRMWLVTP
jgi:hypothetical protein